MVPAIAFLAALLSVLTPGAACAQPPPDDGIVTSEADDHFMRRCKPGPKQEHCYWAKTGDNPAARR